MEKVLSDKNYHRGGVTPPLQPNYSDSAAFKKKEQYFTSTDETLKQAPYLDEESYKFFDETRILYDTILKIMFNFRQSGHPGGAISVGPQLIGLFLNSLRYDISNPDNEQNDVIGLASGHKANGLYAILTLLFEAVKLRHPEAMPKDAILFKDMLGFRRNKTYHSKLVDQYNPVRMEGHPIPETPFVRIASGASGYAAPQLLGLALSLRETFPESDSPIVYMLEGDGGSTPGRFQEAYQCAHNMKLGNVAFLTDFNNANIDENCVAGCLKEKYNANEGNVVSWTPEQLAATHGGNVITINDGHDFQQVIAGLDLVGNLMNKSGRFAAGVFHTTKSKGYDPMCCIVGRKYHGAGHKPDSQEYFAAQEEFEKHFNVKLPRMPQEHNQDVVEEYFLKSLDVVRDILKNNSKLTDFIVDKVMKAKDRIPKNRTTSSTDITPLMKFVPDKPLDPSKPPAEFIMKPGKGSYREMYVNIVGYINKLTNGAFWVVSADLLSSTLPNITKYLGGSSTENCYYGEENRSSRILHGGGITEDANAGLMLGLGAGGRYTGVTTSYGAFQSLAHTHVKVANGPWGSEEREHRIPVQIGAFHASLWTGPDGVRTHADPQALAVWRENFPYRSLITLLPIDPNEIFPMFIASYRARPVAIVPFIARPDGVVFDREKLGFALATEAAKGGYILRPTKPGKKVDGTIVLQGAGVAKIFIENVLPEIDKKWNVSIAVITSHELFRMQPVEYRDKVLPYTDKERTRRNSIAITEFTEGTIRPYVDELGMRYSLYSYKVPSQIGKDADENESIGPYGSGEPDEIFIEAHLDAKSQYDAVDKYLGEINK